MNTEAQLTKRETEIAELLAWGGLTKEVADKLYISQHTVKTTVKNIYRKTEVRSVGQLSAWYFCTRFNISKMMNPLLSLLFICLVGVTEINTDDQVMRARTSRARTSRAKRK
jgi:DNA-binding CsgD family transcriptional regulator